ncbi:DUF551 domain-containing protein [Yersinia ruckeri]|uniref:DUF551 domain-containing protein n=1 Tax=Yersinia ruckeri TaxID=29486 RepID=UPI0008FCFA22|nr:DUF551 domain-containing protein [Yersinia ruckeri]ARZ01840.1 hypothetical protein QMA0440_02518 [Yersinia ruckeri]MCW6523060.1 DUF551 domain-containing protein [Yersinia ruckeri]MCW6594184.1 DUF551 domain-containing protein [Yersinia ruckeri]MCW6603549.1 DUF551 domain-containing protein [Yersinia ruckeri]OIX43511.1 hypothetical protein AXW22_12185 [Yersinia ruckeri]
MNNELDSFTVERLEKIIAEEGYSAMRTAKNDEVRALARIALAAKRAEPVINIKFKDGWPVPKSVGVVDAGQKLADGYHDFYTTPQLNFPVIPDGWIKCSDRMPENSNIQCFVHCKDSIRRTGYFDGDDWAINGKYYDKSFVTHWMQLPGAPKKPL